MTPIEPLKIAGPISARVPAKPKAEAATDTGAFSKLLSSVDTKAEVREKAAPANRLAEIEEALEALEELPIEELPAEQQELLVAMIELLSLQAAQVNTQLYGQKPGYAEEITQNPSLPNLADENGALQQQMVELMQQIAHKMQELQAITSKEFANVPIFVGVEKEYILNDPNKVNEVMEVLEGIIAELKAGQTGELLKQATGNTDEVAMVPVQRNDSQTAIPTHQPGVKPEVASPVVRISNLAEDLGGVLKGSLKLTGAGENAQIKVSIFPEHLGQLEIRLSTVDGKVAAQIFTSNALAKEALDMQVFQLRNALVQQGITVDRIEISEQPASQSFNHQREQRFTQQQSQQQRQTSAKNGYQLLEEDTALSVRPAASEGLVISVDYTI